MSTHYRKISLNGKTLNVSYFQNVLYNPRFLGFFSPEYTKIFCSVTKSCPTLCNPMDYCMPGFPIEPEKCDKQNWTCLKQDIGSNSTINPHMRLLVRHLFTIKGII